MHISLGACLESSSQAAQVVRKQTRFCDCPGRAEQSAWGRVCPAPPRPDASRARLQVAALVVNTFVVSLAAAPTRPANAEASSRRAGEHALDAPTPDGGRCRSRREEPSLDETGFGATYGDCSGGRAGESMEKAGRAVQPGADALGDDVGVVGRGRTSPARRRGRRGSLRTTVSRSRGIVWTRGRQWPVTEE